MDKSFEQLKILIQEPRIKAESFLNKRQSVWNKKNIIEIQKHLAGQIDSNSLANNSNVPDKRKYTFQTEILSMLQKQIEKINPNKSSKTESIQIPDNNSDEFEEGMDELMQDLGIGEILQEEDLLILERNLLRANIAKSKFQDNNQYKKSLHDIKAAFIKKFIQQAKLKEFELKKEIMESEQQDFQQIPIHILDPYYDHKQSQMIKNKFFHQFFKKYQSNLQKSLKQIDGIKEINGKIQMDNQKKNFGKEIDEFINKKNSYRKNVLDLIIKNISKTESVLNLEEFDKNYRSKLFPQFLPENLNFQRLDYRSVSLKQKIERIKSSNNLRIDDIQKFQEYNDLDKIPSIFEKVNPVLNFSSKQSLQNLRSERDNSKKIGKYEFEQKENEKQRIIKINKILQNNYGKWYLKKNQYGKNNQNIKNALMGYKEKQSQQIK